MSRRIRRPSPALVVAIIALFVALGGSAIAAGVVPLAKRALLANNAVKLQGKTPAQVAALAPAPPPVSSVASLVSVGTANFNLNPSTSGTFSVPCTGAKAISGGFSSPQAVLGADTTISADGATFSILLINFSSTAAASGAIYAVCLK
jgi:hypothetical protein